MPPGAPTKFRKVFCKRLIELAKDGRTIEEACADFQISIDTYYKWKKRYPEFAEADSEALPLRTKFWIDIGRKGIVAGGHFREKTWQFLMMNISKWGMRNIIEEPQPVEDKTADELNSELKELAERAKKKTR
jgi:hypothetical protein